jgi:hypothetical protein
LWADEDGEKRPGCGDPVDPHPVVIKTASSLPVLEEQTRMAPDAAVQVSNFRSGESSSARKG